MRLFKPLTNIQNAIAGQKMQIICPVRNTYDYVLVGYTGTAVARSDFKNIKVLANGEPIWDFADGDQLDQFNDYYKRDDTAGFLAFFFNKRREEMVQLGDQRIFGLGTLDLDTLVIEADIDATAPADLAVTAEAQLSEQQPLGVFNRIRRVNFNSSVAGQVDVDKIPVGPRLMAIHGFKADISDMEVYLDDALIWDAPKTRAEKYQKDYGRVPQTAVATHVDFMLEGDVAQAIVTEAREQNRRVRDLLLKPTLDTSGAVTFLVEYLDTLTSKAA